MRRIIILFLGILLIYSGISKSGDICCCIRYIRFKGFFAVILRLLNIAAGTFLIAMIILGRL